MSHRFPVSLATKTYRMLLEANPEIRLEELTGDWWADLRSPSYQRCVRSYIPEFSGKTRDMKAYATAATNYLAGVVEYPTPDDLGFIKRWSMCRQVYRFSDELADALASSRMDSVPASALKRLPYPIVYIDAKLGRYRGFVAYIEEGYENMRISFIDNDMRRFPYFVSLKDGYTIEDAQKDFQKESDMSASVGIHVENDAEKSAAMVFSAMPFLLYILSDNAEDQVVSKPSQVQRIEKQDMKRNSETVHEMGARLGRAIGEARRRQRADAASSGTERKMPPHIRAAHFTHYWIGPRKGRTDGKPGDACIVHWIPPLAINGGGGDEVIHPAE